MQDTSIQKETPQQPNLLYSRGLCSFAEIVAEVG